MLPLQLRMCSQLTNSEDKTHSTSIFHIHKGSFLILHYIKKKIDAEPVVYTTVKELSYIQRIVLRNSVVSQVKLQAIRCLTLTLDNNCIYEKKLKTDLV